MENQSFESMNYLAKRMGTILLGESITAMSSQHTVVQKLQMLWLIMMSKKERKLLLEM